MNQRTPQKIKNISFKSYNGVRNHIFINIIEIRKLFKA